MANAHEFCSYVWNEKTRLTGNVVHLTCLAILTQCTSATKDEQRKQQQLHIKHPATTTNMAYGSCSTVSLIILIHCRSTSVQPAALRLVFSVISLCILSFIFSSSCSFFLDSCRYCTSRCWDTSSSLRTWNNQFQRHLMHNISNTMVIIKCHGLSVHWYWVPAA